MRKPVVWKDGTLHGEAGGLASEQWLVVQASSMNL